MRTGGIAVLTIDQLRCDLVHCRCHAEFDVSRVCKNARFIAAVSDGAGKVMVTWKTQTGSPNEQHLQFTKSTDHGSTWSTETIVSGPAYYISAPVLANIGDVAYAAWIQNDGSNDRVYTARKRIGTGSWSTPVVVSANPASATLGLPTEVMIAAATGGYVYVAYVGVTKDTSTGTINSGSTFTPRRTREFRSTRRL